MRYYLSHGLGILPLVKLAREHQFCCETFHFLQITSRKVSFLSKGFACLLSVFKSKKKLETDCAGEFACGHPGDINTFACFFTTGFHFNFFSLIQRKQDVKESGIISSKIGSQNILITM